LSEALFIIYLISVYRHWAEFPAKYIFYSRSALPILGRTFREFSAAEKNSLPFTSFLKAFGIKKKYYLCRARENYNISLICQELERIRRGKLFLINSVPFQHFLYKIGENFAADLSGQTINSASFLVTRPNNRPLGTVGVKCDPLMGRKM
jgi:hypothetical protein